MRYIDESGEYLTKKQITKALLEIANKKTNKEK